jgi:hypothetical protein
VIHELRLTKKNKDSTLRDILQVVTSSQDWDFYYTKDNSRIFVQDTACLKDFLKQCTDIYFSNTDDDIDGIVMLWKSLGGDKTRYYVKIKASEEKVAENLLTVLLWNVKQDVYAKIRQDHKFYDIFKHKGFRFEGGRGVQSLLKYRKLNEKRQDYGKSD